MYAPRSERAELKQRAERLLGHFGLDGANRSVVQLSGGERQRVAVARALTKTTSILLADEPTASLDREMADSLINYLMEHVRNTGKTLIAVSHDPKLLCRMDQTVELEGGLITGSMKAV
jgi:putative ABC transport system ATP-binding protein